MGRKNQNADLGRAISRQRAKDSRDAQAKGRELGVGSTEQHARAQLQSVLDASDLTELMENVAVSNTMFGGPGVAVPLAPQVVVLAPTNNARPKAAAERARDHDANDLRIPRRPAWNEHTTPEQLEENEKSSFLAWRRGIAEVEESLAVEAGFGGLMLTPFEKNIQVWRQLWRVVERSDAVIQIVDARNPLLYFCPDLERYVVKEMRRSHILLVNKADLLTSKMISRWQSYFEEQGLEVLFFSAFKASVDEQAHDPRIIRAEELVRKLHTLDRTCPITRPDQQLTVGMVGYPNVGKSSTINILLQDSSGDEKQTGSPQDLEFAASDIAHQDLADALHPNFVTKRVAVSATPGKTKHFQTLVLSEQVVLCDCPGLVFPNFSASKAELICAGVLSIDQMRGDPVGPVSLIARRIPAVIFEGVYGLRFTSKIEPYDLENVQPITPTGHVTAEILLETHARARGFMSDHDKPDISRSARLLLKDYVSGRVIFAHAPPPYEEHDGEPGIGPDVISRKGKLIHARALALNELDSGVVSRDGRLESSSDAEHGKDESIQLSPGPVAATYSDRGSSMARTGLADKAKEPVARVKRGKKEQAEVFTRVTRPY